MQSLGFFLKKLEHKICWILGPKTAVVYSLRPILSALQISATFIFVSQLHIVVARKIS